MRTIFQYKLFNILGYALDEKEVTISIPVGATLLDVQVSGFHICLWVESQYDSVSVPCEDHIFKAYVSGQTMPKSTEFTDKTEEYLATVQINDGRATYHIYTVYDTKGDDS